MKLFKNKKALASSILVILIVMFATAFMSLTALVMANQFINTINGVSNETISQDVKDNIVNNTQFIYWGDKLFVMLFICLLAAFLISSMTLEVQKPIFFFIFAGILIFTCVLAMWLSNAWTYVLQDDLIRPAVQNLKFTDYFMRFLPIITFVTGIMGAVIFYGRKQSGFSNGGGTSGIE